MPGSFLHSLAASLAAVAAVFVAGVVTDGRSLVEADLNSEYGIGLYQDSKGRHWEDKEHAANNCSELKAMGQGTLGTSLVAMIMTGLSVFFHTVGASAENWHTCWAVTTLCLNIVAALAFVAASVLAILFYTKAFCGAKLKDHFTLRYVLCFATVAMFVCAVLSLFVACSRPAKAEAAPPAASPTAERNHERRPQRPAPAAERNHEMRPQHPVPAAMYPANPEDPTYTTGYTNGDSYNNGDLYNNGAPYGDDA